MGQNTVPEAMPEQVESAPAVIDPLERFDDHELLVRIANAVSDLVDISNAKVTVATGDHNPDVPTDHEILVVLLAKVEGFEQLIKQMGEAADKNPMFKMMFGKLLGS